MNKKLYQYRLRRDKDRVYELWYDIIVHIGGCISHEYGTFEVIEHNKDDEGNFIINCSFKSQNSDQKLLEQFS